MSAADGGRHRSGPSGGALRCPGRGPTLPGLPSPLGFGRRGLAAAAAPEAPLAARSAVGTAPGVPSAEMAPWRAPQGPRADGQLPGEEGLAD